MWLHDRRYVSESVIQKWKGFKGISQNYAQPSCHSKLYDFHYSAEQKSWYFESQTILDPIVFIVWRKKHLTQDIKKKKKKKVPQKCSGKTWGW